MHLGSRASQGMSQLSAHQKAAIGPSEGMSQLLAHVAAIGMSQLLACQSPVYQSPVSLISKMITLCTSCSAARRASHNALLPEGLLH